MKKRSCLVILCAIPVMAQTFEVASVKPAGPDEPLDLRVQPGGRLTVTNLQLGDLIRQAYGVSRYQMTGGPSWLESDRFDIQAKAAGDPPRGEMMKMLQALLEDRFQLKVHRETREGTVYYLVVAKGGLKLSAPKNTRARSGVFVGRTGAITQEAITYYFQGQNATIAMLIPRLQDTLRHPVIDRTGVEGNFDFKIEYTADDAKPENGPSLMTAVQNVGLRLESGKGPVEMFVVDHAEKPGAN